MPRIFRKPAIPKRILSLLLALILTVCCLPPLALGSSAAGNTAEILGAKGSDFTPNAYIAGKLQELFDLLPYSNYPYFTTYGNKSCGNNWCSYCMGANVARQHPNLKDLGIYDPHTCWSCFGFARYAFLYIYGITATGLNYYGNVSSGDNLQRVGRVARSGIGNISGSYDPYTRASLLALLEKATPGDILQCNGSSGSGNHTMIFLASDSEGVTVLHANMFKNNTDSSGNVYSYNRVLVSKISYENMMSYWGSIVSVLRAKESVYVDTWNKGGSICDSHTYTEDGGDACTVCGMRFAKKLDPSAAGLYETVTSATIRQNAYFSATRNETLSKGEAVSVVASTVNSIGETWYLLTSGDYTHGDNLKKLGDSGAQSSSAPTFSVTSAPEGSLKLGAAFNLRGSVTASSGSITELCGYVISTDGKTTLSATSSHSSSKVDLYSSGINYNLKFGTLSAGSYIFLLSAKDSSGRMSLFRSSFTVSLDGGSYIPAAPAAPTLSGRTHSTVTLTQMSGMEYRLEDGTWQRSNLFTGLSPSTTYRFYQRIAATESSNASAASPALTVTTDKIKETNTPTPILASRTDTSVTLKTVSGYEYSMDGVNFQSSPTFGGLDPLTSYLFYQRMAASDTAYVGDVSLALTVTTDKSTPDAPDAPILLSVGEDTLIYEEHELFEYSLDKKTWQSSGIFTGLIPGSTYYAYARIKATETTYASSPSQGSAGTTDKTYPAPPAAPILADKNGGTVRLTETAGMEYSLDGSTWQRSPVFEGLEVSKIYTFYQRKAETGRSYASEISPGLQVEIIPGSLTSGYMYIDNDTMTVRRIAPGTALRTVISSLLESEYIRVYNRDGEQIGGSRDAATGMQLVICDGDRKEVVYTLIVRGDLDGDGLATVADATMLSLHLEAVEQGNTNGQLSEENAAAWLAADVTGDGHLDRLDLSALRGLLLGTFD